MSELAKWLYLVALGVWAGSMVFFRCCVIPIMLRVLNAEEAVRLRRALLSRYYAMGSVCAAIGLMCVGILLAEQSFSIGPGVLSLLLLAGAGSGVFWLRQTASEGERKPSGRSYVRLHVAVFVAVLALFFLAVFGHVV